MEKQFRLLVIENEWRDRNFAAVGEIYCPVTNIYYIC